MAQPATTTSDVLTCFSCGRGFSYSGPRPDSGSGRFCSTNCRDYFDAGKRPGESTDTQKLRSGWRVVAGPHPGHPPRPMRRGAVGFFIPCLGCGRELESKGLAFCAPECGRLHRERMKNREDMLDAPAAKRRCETCGGNIPRWRDGRQVSKATRFCSPSCQGKASRNRREATKVQTSGFEWPNAQKVPENKGRASGPESTERSREDVP
jgi:hypothetical protein